MLGSARLNSAALRYYFESRVQNSRAGTRRSTFQDLLRLAEQGDVLAGRALNRMAAPVRPRGSHDCWRPGSRGDYFHRRTYAAWRLAHHRRRNSGANAFRRAYAITYRARWRYGRVRGTMVLVLQKHFGAPLSAVAREPQIAHLGLFRQSAPVITSPTIVTTAATNRNPAENADPPVF